MTATRVRDPITDVPEWWDAGVTAEHMREFVLQLTDDPTPLGTPDAPPAVPVMDIVDEWGRQSFPASDPPANW